MTVQITHDDLIKINIQLAPVPMQSASFTTLLLLCDEADGTTLGGDRVRVYQSFTEVDADKSVLGAKAIAMAQAAFSQRSRRPDRIKIGRVDTGNGESYADGLAAVSSVDNDWFGVCVDSRAVADQLAVAAVVETKHRIFVFQSSDSDWKGSTFPSAYSAVSGARNSGVVYHDTDSVWHDVRWAASRLAWNPDETSASWEAAIAGGTDLAAGLSSTELLNLRDNNANVALPFGSSPHFMDPGCNLEGRAFYEVVTAYWFHDRLQRRIADMKVATSERGAKLGMDPTGLALVQSQIETQFALGVLAGHFVEGQTEVVMQPITDSDLAARRIRARGRAQFLVSGRVFEFDFNFDAQPLE